MTQESSGEPEAGCCSSTWCKGLCSPLWCLALGVAAVAALLLVLRCRSGRSSEAED